MVFDLDCEDAYFRAEERGLPKPNFTAINRNNGHAHLGYQLETPVNFFASSSVGATKFYEAVERGFTHRLGADWGYSGFVSKNPLHPQWEVEWASGQTYDLGRLNDYLEPKDKQRRLKSEMSGVGRNVTTFNHIREIAYKEVLKFKKAHKSEDRFMEFLEDCAGDLNRTFSHQLHRAEIRCLARSVSKFVWKEFSIEKFSAIQSCRGKRAWSKTLTLTKEKPWELEGVCRRTWERRRAAQASPFRAII
jgi:hypothetical protein